MIGSTKVHTLKKNIEESEGHKITVIIVKDMRILLKQINY